MKLLLSVILVSSLSAWSRAYAQCFLPNGTDRNLVDDPTGQTKNYQPCPGPTKMCCRTGDGTDRCDPSGSGLCIGSVWWRESCSDKTWKDPGCVHLFTNGIDVGDGTDLHNTDASLRHCPDGSWCQGANNQGCCDSKQGVMLVNGKVVSSTTSTTTKSSPTTTSKATTADSTTVPTTAASTATPTDSSNSQQSGVDSSSSSSSNTPAIVGGVVGGILGGALLIGLVVFLVLRSRRRRRQRAEEEAAAAATFASRPPIIETKTPPGYSQGPSPVIGQAKTGYYGNIDSADGPVTVHELPVHPYRSEMAAREVPAKEMSAQMRRSMP